MLSVREKARRDSDGETMGTGMTTSIRSVSEGNLSVASGVGKRSSVAQLPSLRFSPLDAPTGVCVPFALLILYIRAGGKTQSLPSLMSDIELSFFAYDAVSRPFHFPLFPSIPSSSSHCVCVPLNTSCVPE